MRAILGQLATRTRLTLGGDLADGAWSDILERFGPDGAFQEVLTRLAQADSRPLVLLIDEILHKGLERTIRDGLEQTAAYMDRCAADAGHLVIFDRRDEAWEDKVFHRRESVGAADVHVWGM